MHIFRYGFLILIVAMTGLLSACGQKGPLYLPKQPAVKTAPPSTTPAPSAYDKTADA